MSPHLERYLRTEHLARALERHAAIDSTSTRAREAAKNGAPHGFCVVAGAQTAGRGRRSRTWHSPPGAGLYVSFVVRPKIAPRFAALLSITTGVALVRAITRVCEAEVRLKWPNDLLAGPRHAPFVLRKVAGILIDLAADANVIDHAVIGVGINLRETERPDAITGVATSLEALSGGAPDRDRLLAELANELELALATLENEGPAPILAAWKTLAVGIDQPVTIDAEGAQMNGVLRGLGEDGALLLDTAQGPRTIYAGDLLLPGAPRPADRARSG